MSVLAIVKHENVNKGERLVHNNNTTLPPNTDAGLSRNITM